MTATQLGDTCSLYIDMQPEQPGIKPGDWIATAARSRYLVAAARAVRPRRPHAVHRLPKHCAVSGDVRALELRWYRRCPSPSTTPRSPLPSGASPRAGRT